MTKRVFLGIAFILVGAVLFAQLTPVVDSNGFSKVTQGEYEFSWKITGANIEIIMSAPTQGWVAIGFKAERAMQGADIAIGYVGRDGAVISDDYGSSPVSHRADSRGGGSDDLTIISSDESDGRTTLHFSRPLNTGDDRDAVLRAGELTPVIFAWGRDRADNTTAVHAARGSFEVEL